jgi:hypothetical protein
MHGGKGSGAPKGKANGRYKTGLHTKEMRAEMKAIRAMIRESREFIDGI